MKILVVGATGTIGRHVVNELKGDFEILTASKQNADIQVDISSPDSIKEMYKKVGKIDALISTTGSTHYGLVTEMTPEQNMFSLENKVAGQINLVLLGLEYINDNGSITLTSGVTMDDPIREGASAAMANGAIKAFVQSAAIEMPRGIRINNVSPNILEDSVNVYGDYFKGFVPVAGQHVAMAYRKSVQGAQTGQTYKVY